MKRIMIVLLLVSSFLTYGQHDGRGKNMNEDFTPEQQAVLATKKMTLALDLNDAQQKQLLELNKKWMQKKSERKAAMKTSTKEDMTSKEKFDHMNSMLDDKIAFQNSMKKILDKEQYEMYKKSSQRMKARSKDRPESYHNNQQRSKQRS